MRHSLLLLSYWFPPNNAVGASRAAALARFFADQGWDVTVVAADSSAVSKDFALDLSGIDVHRVTETETTQLFNFKANRRRLMRALSAVGRYGVFPDVFRSTTRKMGKVADGLIAQGRSFDVVLSTALPFSQHEVAGRIAKRAGALLVLDNRDTWACNAYRRRLPLSERRERAYERRVLANADMVTAISDGMTRYYRESYPDLAARFSTIRNGVDGAEPSAAEPISTPMAELRIVYTGILYKEKRDIRPVLEAARRSGLRVAFDFYGSEAKSVADFKAQFPDVEIVDHGRVSRAEAMKAQRSAGALLVALGHDEAEKTFLPGKFFEYVGTGRQIIAIADDDFEISGLVHEHELGIATRDPGEIATFLTALVAGKVQPRRSVPEPLTRDYQLGLMEGRVLAALEARSARTVSMARGAD
jgi:glycosyltransferase involved in cell wall biosynthesis